MEQNLILRADGYKPSHAFQYPEGTTHISSYGSARGSSDDVVVFYGLQAFIKECLLKHITLGDVAEAEEFYAEQGAPFDKEMWLHIVKVHKGKLPLLIQAVPEGTLLPIGVPCYQVINTDPRCFALTSFIETQLLRAIWYPVTVASLSASAVQVIRHALEESGTPELARYKLVDFGARGATCSEAAGIAGSGHLLSSDVTDTMEAVRYAQRNYGAKISRTTIPATEHSTTTAWKNEVDAVANMIDKFGNGMFACVIDSNKDETFIKELCGSQLRNKIDALPARGGVMIFRPDSGNPVEHPIEVLNWLGETFGFTVNEKGYKILPQHIRVIQGDGMNIYSLSELCANVINANWSIDNISFGMGGGLLQGSQAFPINRDTYRFAMKANERWDSWGKHPIKKNCATDSSKASIGGRVDVFKNIETNQIGFCSEGIPPNEVEIELFREVFKNGELLINESFDTIKERLEAERLELVETLKEGRTDGK